MADAQQASLLGKLVGRYRIEKRLGSGGMGEVYLARQLEIGSRVAIKVMTREAKTDSEGAKRMFAEARAVNLVQHDRIVNVLDMTRIEGRPALIMEYLRGVSLDRLLANGPLPPRCIACLAIDVLDALAAVHALEIFHRDLKPGNVYVSPEGRATLLDFGLAKMADALLGTVIQTQVGVVMGTVPYMAPEQARGEPFVAASDLFAVGLLLYEGATAKRAYRGRSIPDLLREHEQGPDRPRRLNPAIPTVLEDVILRALATDPADRYVSADAMRLALIEISPQLEPASVRARVDRFRESSAVFVGVQPEFSNLVTVPANDDGGARGRGGGRRAQARARGARGTDPSSPGRGNQSRVVIALAALAAFASVAALVLAVLLWRARSAEHAPRDVADTARRPAAKSPAAKSPAALPANTPSAKPPSREELAAKNAGADAGTTPPSEAQRPAEDATESVATESVATESDADVLDPFAERRETGEGDPRRKPTPKREPAPLGAGTTLDPFDSAVLE